MAVRPFVPWPDPRLRTPAEPVGEITDEIRRIWDDMVDTMEAMPGLGLAAPQIGVMLRLAVVDCSEERGQAVRLADPEIVSASSTLRSHDEASPNLAGVHARLERPAQVEVAFNDETGTRVQRVFEGLWATSVQHQIDHLQGRMYVDRLSRTKREMLLKKARKSRGVRL
ncbi:peptide deformylase [Tropicimonas isoalkanivorans]|uniref:Peptide deformylase-like n=1 Tax=Tropicimonas isoalkanivorans TaxID=441112 RepID=A0A1I1PIS9_9RHOB|nr:peptide deformylase [Tropicimonas isoalkanivorans]SFD06843.1 peptide deformylase [Tropicimonas isoalkanivorans]